MWSLADEAAADRQELVDDEGVGDVDEEGADQGTR